MSHLLNCWTDSIFSDFGEERCPGGEVLLELGVRVRVAAVAAAGGAAPGHLKGGSFIRAASRGGHADYRHISNNRVANL